MSDRICPKCRLSHTPEEYGSQRYCRSCWRKYNRERARARRRKNIPEEVISKIKELRYFIETVPGLRNECTEELAQLAVRYAVEDVE